MKDFSEFLNASVFGAGHDGTRHILITLLGGAGEAYGEMHHGEKD
jgi:hypothetical protein